MKVLILTHNADRHLHFAARMIEETGAVVGVITGGKRESRPVLRKAFRRPYGSCRRFIVNQLNRQSGFRFADEKNAAERQTFAAGAERFRNRHSQLVLRAISRDDGTINAAHVVRHIYGIKPDVLAVMGTTLLSSDIIQSAPVALNLHTGLSPYYRGGLSNFWPVIEQDYGRFGVTVHKLSTGIDSGDIVSSDRILVEPDDTFACINCRAIERGIDLMVAALQHLVKSGHIGAVPQWTKGKLFHDRHYSHAKAAQYFASRSTFVAEHLRRQQFNQLQPARLIFNGEG